MSEEVRFMLRIAAYTALIATIYWFVAYERAGTTMLVFLALAAGFLVLWALRSLPAARPRSKAPADLVGLSDPPAESETALEIEEDVFPGSSLWPVVLAVGVTLLALGPLFGPWLWIPGLVLTASSGVLWAQEML